MYKSIEKHPSTYEVYKKKLIEEGHFTIDEIEVVSANIWLFYLFFLKKNGKKNRLWKTR